MSNESQSDSEDEDRPLPRGRRKKFPREQDDEDEERRPVRRSRRRDDDEDDDYDDDTPDNTGGLIPYKNPKALSAYYCGVFSLIPCLGLILGPIALILGILGMKHNKQHPKSGGMGHAIAGIVLGGLTTLLNFGVVIFFVIAAVMGSMK